MTITTLIGVTGMDQSWITFEAGMPTETAQALAAFLKRAVLDNFLHDYGDIDNQNYSEASRVLEAAQHLRRALAEAGIEPQ